MTAAAAAPPSLRARALAIVLEADPAAKIAAARALADGSAAPDPDERFAEPRGVPGRPLRPQLVAPAALAQRPVHTREGRAALFHALAHIELNAVDLALDLVWRFAGMPQEFYRDWIGVAAEEATHFELLAAQMAELGAAYGDFPAHGALWEMAAATSGDLLARLALVPRTLEARGLDASPPIRAKLERAGDAAGARLLERILRDEIGHVALGNRWYRWLCAARAVDPHSAWRELVVRYNAPRLRGPFNLEARRAAGFDEAELALLVAADAASARCR